MNALEQLKQDLRRSSSPLVADRPLEHSQELEDHLPAVRRYVGPRAWYLCLESHQPAENPA